MIYKISNLSLNDKAWEVKRGNETIDLTKTEFNVLKFLIENKDRFVTPDEVLNVIGEEKTMNYVRVCINRLREKIDNGYKPHIIKTMINVGYRAVEH